MQRFSGVAPPPSAARARIPKAAFLKARLTAMIHFKKNCISRASLKRSQLSF